jgi:hypothetical protein
MILTIDVSRASPRRDEEGRRLLFQALIEVGCVTLSVTVSSKYSYSAVL